MTSKEVLLERERIKKIVSEKVDELIAYRIRTLKKKNKVCKTAFYRLSKNINFLIDNPNYQRKTH